MYKNCAEFLEDLDKKVTEKIQAGTIDIQFLAMLTSEVVVLVDAATDFEALVEGTMLFRGLENLDTTTLEMMKETNQKIQDTYTSIIALVDGV